MEKRNHGYPSFLKRFVMPVAIVFSVMAISFIIYNTSLWLKSETLHYYIATIAGVILFLSIAFGTFFVYTMAYRRGASLTERIVASCLNPFIWATKEVIRITASFTLLESIYFYFGPLQVWLFFAVISEIGLSELLCRRGFKKRGGDIKAFSIPAFVTFILGLFMVIFLFAWGEGVYYFYIFIEIFRRFFGPGVGV